MDFLIWYGLFCYSLGGTVIGLLTWLWCRYTPKRTPYRYDVQDEVDMILESIEF